MKIFIVISLFFCALQFSYAQETNPASRAEAIGVVEPIGCAVGQLVYTNPVTSLGSLNQGVQQSIEFVNLSNPELMAVILKADIYPNPTAGYVVLKFTDIAIEKLQFTLFHLNA